MTSRGQRRPVSARDFNRLLFALLLLGALTILARLVTKQESKAAVNDQTQTEIERWLQTADALFVSGEWRMAADAYFGALDAAAEVDPSLDPRLYKKLAECLLKRGDVRAGTYFLRQYRGHLVQLQTERITAGWPPNDPLLDAETLSDELHAVDTDLHAWSLVD
jgi:hypothetical protein